jgi:hypothetical protein
MAEPPFLSNNPGGPQSRPIGRILKGAELLVANRTIKTIPDWNAALRPDFMEKAKFAA